MQSRKSDHLDTDRLKNDKITEYYNSQKNKMTRKATVQKEMIMNYHHFIGSCQWGTLVGFSGAILDISQKVGVISL